MTFLIGIVIGIFAMTLIIHRRNLRKDREFYATMLKLYSECEGPTGHLDAVMKSVNPNKRGKNDH